MDWIVYFTVFIATYIISSQVILLFLIGLFHRYEEPPHVSLFFLSLGLGPITISILTKLLVDLFPYHSNYFYISIISISFLLLCGLSYNKVGLLVNTYRFFIERIKKTKLVYDYFKITIFILLAVVYFFVFVQASALPILGSDSLRFVWNSKKTYETVTDVDNKTAKINRLDKIKIIVKGKHSPEALYTWFFLTNKSAMADRLCRTAAPIYYLLLMILMVYLLWRKGQWVWVWGLIFFVSIPLMLAQTILNSQDQERIYLFILTFAWLAYAIEKKKAIYFIWWIYVLWCGIFCAQANYLAALFSLVAIIVLLLTKLKRFRLILPLILCLIVGVFAASDIRSLNRIDDPESLPAITGIRTYTSNTATLNKINTYKGNKYIYLLRSKYVSLQKLFDVGFYNVLAFVAIVSILYWFIRRRDKTSIDIIFLVSLFSYIFLIVFQNNQILLQITPYKSRMVGNEYFFIYGRYLLMTMPFMVYFSAILMGDIFNLIKVDWLKMAITIPVLVVLFIPVESKLINRKSSLGIDDWKKIFFASDYEKLLSYRTGYAGIIDYIRKNVDVNDKILTNMEYKFIPYYSQRECIGLDSFLAATSERDPMRLYEAMKEMRIKYILPTEKGRAFSSINHSPVQKVMNRIDLAFIVYDSDYWQMYKLREERKETVKSLIYIPNRKFDRLDGNHPVNWSVYSAVPGLIVERDRINWGVENDEGDINNKTCFLENTDVQQSSYVYTGPGELKYPPSSYKDDRYKIEKSTDYYLTWTASGSRPVVINFWLIEYDQNGEIKWNLKRQMLSNNFKEMVASFKTGEGAKEYRIAFHVSDVATVFFKDIGMYEVKFR